MCGYWIPRGYAQMDLYHAIRAPSDLGNSGPYSLEVSPLWIQIATQSATVPPLQELGAEVHYPFSRGGASDEYSRILRNNPFVSRLATLMDRVGLDRSRMGVFFFPSGPGFSGYHSDERTYRMNAGLNMYLRRPLFTTWYSHEIGLLESSEFGESAEEYWRETESALEQAAEPFITAGLERESALRLLRSMSGVMAGDHAELSDILAGHEFAHMVFHPSYTAVEESLLRGHSVESISDTLARAFMRAGLLSEVMSDAFGAVSSGRPRSLLELRYTSGLFTSYQLQRQGDLPRSYGQPLRIRVFDPSVIESESSPLYNAVRSAIQVTAEEGIHAARAGNPPEPPQWDLFSLGQPDPQQMAGMLGDMFAYSAYNAVSNVQKLAEAYRSRSQPVSAEEGRRLYEMATAAGSSVASMINSGIMLSTQFPHWLQVTGDARTVLDHIGSRLWVIPYMVGKSRPDLIGRDVEVYPDRLQVVGGESLDVESILPESIGLVGLSEETPVHPELYHASRMASRMYRTGLYELRGESPPDPSPDLSAEVVLSWRRNFNRIIRSWRGTASPSDPS